MRSSLVQFVCRLSLSAGCLKHVRISFVLSWFSAILLAVVHCATILFIRQRISSTHRMFVDLLYDAQNQWAEITSLWHVYVDGSVLRLHFGVSDIGCRSL